MESSYKLTQPNIAQPEQRLLTGIQSVIQSELAKNLSALEQQSFFESAGPCHIVYMLCLWLTKSKLLAHPHCVSLWVWHCALQNKEFLLTSLEPHDSCQIFFILPHQFIYLFIVLIFGLQSLSSLFSGRRFVEKNSPFDWTTFFILNVNLYLKGRGKPRGRERKHESIWFLWSMARSKSTKSTDILPFVIFLVCGVKCWGGSVDRTGYGPT